MTAKLTTGSEVGAVYVNGEQDGGEVTSRCGLHSSEIYDFSQNGGNDNARDRTGTRSGVGHRIGRG